MAAGCKASLLEPPRLCWLCPGMQGGEGGLRLPGGLLRCGFRCCLVCVHWSRWVGRGGGWAVVRLAGQLEGCQHRKSIAAGTGIGDGAGFGQVTTAPRHDEALGLVFSARRHFKVQFLGIAQSREHTYEVGQYAAGSERC